MPGNRKKRSGFLLGKGCGYLTVYIFAVGFRALFNLLVSFYFFEPGTTPFLIVPSASGGLLYFIVSGKMPAYYKTLAGTM